MSAVDETGKAILDGLDFHPVCSLVSGVCKRPASFGVQTLCCSLVVSMVCQQHKEQLDAYLRAKHARGQTTICKQCETPRLSGKFVRFIPIGSKS